MSRRDDNRDFIKGVHYPKQTYALSGSQWGDNKNTTVRGKTPTNGPPMIISPQPPGAFAFDDEAWSLVFGASMDAFLSLLRGQELSNNQVSAEANIDSSSVYKATPSALNSSIYEEAAGQQQVQYVVSKNTVEDASTAQKFGALGDARSIGLRIPMHAAGWGRTISMRPTDPNPLDKRLNDDEHKLDRATWKTGPVDMPWDEQRQCFRAFNDLIADTYARDLGTFVFGTNPDNVRGYPFLRGKLEDAWTVRAIDTNAPAFGADDDTTKTGEVMTTLAHKLYDPNENGAAPLWDVFICNEGVEAICGDETTLIGPTADLAPPDSVEGADASDATLKLRTTAKWHYSDAKVGPIHFTEQDLLPDEVAGKMKLVAGQWCPVFESDDFTDPEAGGGVSCSDIVFSTSVATLTQNSQAVIEDGVFELQDRVCQWNDEYTDCIVDHFGWISKNLGGVIFSLHFLLAPYIQNVLTSVINNITNGVSESFKAIRASIKATLNSIIAQIQACFIACCGEEFVCAIEVPDIKQPKLGIKYVPIEKFSMQYINKPSCDIESFAKYWFDIEPDIEITITNPCTGDTDFSNACGGAGKTSAGKIVSGNPTSSAEGNQPDPFGRDIPGA